MSDRAGRSRRRRPPLPGDSPATEALRTLTARELEILGMVASGQASHAIADALGVTVPTVKSHLQRIYRKLEISNRVQASNIYHLGHPQGIRQR